MSSQYIGQMRILVLIGLFWWTLMGFGNILWNQTDLLAFGLVFEYGIISWYLYWFWIQTDFYFGISPNK